MLYGRSKTMRSMEGCTHANLLDACLRSYLTLVSHASVVVVSRGCNQLGATVPCAMRHEAATNAQ